MTKRLIITVLVAFLGLALSLELVAAAGGGGGGGGGGSGGGTYLKNIECQESGLLTFQQNPAIKPVVLEKADSSTITIEGTWDGTTFSTDEAVLNEAEIYTLRDPKNGDKTFSCPGLKFSCKLVELSLQSCTKMAQEVQAEFTLEHGEIADLKVQLALAGTTRTLTHGKESVSLQLKGLKIKEKAGDEKEKTGPKKRYLLAVPLTEEVKTLQLSLPECVGKYYKYSKIDCVESSERGGEGGEGGDEAVAPSPIEQNGQKLKCGGYLDIKDRVNCRLSLREEQRSEYENFFPEECRSWKDQEACVKLYRSVQNCWKLENSIARISCLQGKVGLTSVASAKATCQGETTCLADLQRNAYILIKLRLYNLEEQAEELLEEGTLSKEEVADFVVKMEESKLAFNQAQSKLERKLVILKARQYWLELVRKVDQRG